MTLQRFQHTLWEYTRCPISLLNTWSISPSICLVSDDFATRSCGVSRSHTYASVMPVCKHMVALPVAQHQYMGWQPCMLQYTFTKTLTSRYLLACYICLFNGLVTAQLEEKHKSGGLLKMWLIPAIGPRRDLQADASAHSSLDLML